MHMGHILLVILVKDRSFCVLSLATGKAKQLSTEIMFRFIDITHRESNTANT